MRIIHIDNYDVCEENGKFLAASFVDYEGVSHSVELTEELEEYFRSVRKEEFREDWEKRFHIDVGINYSEDIFDLNISLNSDTKSAEDVFLEKNTENEIKNEILKLPEKQSKYLKLKIFDELRNIEIAKKFGKNHKTIEESIKVGAMKIIINLKIF